MTKSRSKSGLMLSWTQYRSPSNPLQVRDLGIGAGFVPTKCPLSKEIR